LVLVEVLLLRVILEEVAGGFVVVFEAELDLVVLLLVLVLKVVGLEVEREQGALIQLVSTAFLCLVF